MAQSLPSPPQSYSKCYSDSCYDDIQSRGKLLPAVSFAPSPGISDATIEWHDDDDATLATLLRRSLDAMETLESNPDYMQSCPTLLKRLCSTIPGPATIETVLPAEIEVAPCTEKPYDTPVARRKRGRPRGSKDLKPRKRRGNTKKRREKMRDCQGSIEEAYQRSRLIPSPDIDYQTNQSGYDPTATHYDRLGIHMATGNQPDLAEAIDNAEAFHDLPKELQHDFAIQRNHQQRDTERLDDHQLLGQEDHLHLHTASERAFSSGGTESGFFKQFEASRSSFAQTAAMFEATPPAREVTPDVTPFLLEEIEKMFAHEEVLTNKHHNANDAALVCMACNQGVFRYGQVHFPRGTAKQLCGCPHSVCFSCLTEHFDTKGEDSLNLTCPVCGESAGFIGPRTLLQPSQVHDMLLQLSIQPLVDHEDHSIIIDGQTVIAALHGVFNYIIYHHGGDGGLGTAHVSPSVLLRRLQEYNATRQHQRMTTPRQLQSALETCLRNACFMELRRRPENEQFRREAARRRYTQQLTRFLPQLAVNEPGLMYALNCWSTAIKWVVDILTLSWEQKISSVLQ